MAGEPGPGRNRDADRAEALRAGDVIALSEVYDAFAPRLYDYCHGLLRDRVEAAGALRHVVIAGREHVHRLTEPERLRGWLYAIARKECMRRRDSPNRRTGQEAPEAGDDLTPEELARRGEDRLLAHSALGALSGLQRETIDLTVRHGLDEVDLAGVLGIPLEEIYALAERAHQDLAAALRAVLIARERQGDCPRVVEPAEEWPLSPQAAASLVRHMEGCPACDECEVPAVPADRLLAALPVAAVPAELRLDVLTAATAADRADNHRAIAAWIEPFDEYGWPLPYQPAAPRGKERPSRRRGPLLAAAAAGTGLLLLAAGAMAVLGGGGGQTSAAMSGPVTPGSDDPSGWPDDPEPVPSEPSPTTASPSPSVSKTPSPAPSETPSQTPSQTPSTRPPAAPSTPATREPEPPRAGRLSLQECDIDRNDDSCAIRVTAVGGPVTWRVTGTSGEISASGGGHLAAGESAQVTVTRTAVICWGSRSGSVSFAPGGRPVSVRYC